MSKIRKSSLGLLRSARKSLYEVVLTPSTLESQREDVSLVKATSIKGAARKFCSDKKLVLGPQVMDYERGPRGQRAAFRVSKNWGMFGGEKHYSLSVKEADIL